MNEGYAKFFSAPFPVSKLLSQIKYLVANVL
jgi:hypothetical protein